MRTAHSDLNQPPNRVDDAAEDATAATQAAEDFIADLKHWREVRGLSAARLWGHEIDHLHGKLYTDRMTPGVNPVPVERYHGTGTSWRYDSSAD